MYKAYTGEKPLSSLHTIITLQEARDAAKLSAKRQKKFYADKLIAHKGMPELKRKFYKDYPDDVILPDTLLSRAEYGPMPASYRFGDIKAASATVVDETPYFPLRINRLVVDDLQVGMAMSAPQTKNLQAQYEFFI